MGMGFAPTWLRPVTPPPASQNHFYHWTGCANTPPSPFTHQQEKVSYRKQSTRVSLGKGRRGQGWNKL